MCEKTFQEPRSVRSSNRSQTHQGLCFRCGHGVISPEAAGCLFNFHPRPTESEPLEEFPTGTSKGSPGGLESHQSARTTFQNHRRQKPGSAPWRLVQPRRQGGQKMGRSPGLGQPRCAYRNPAHGQALPPRRPAEEKRFWEARITRSLMS